jgi:hypothetical protein
VLAAEHLRKAGVKTLVVGFSGDVSGGDPAVANDNVAHAGGTDADNDGKSPYAYTATSEDQLIEAVQKAIYDAARGSYSTSPATTANGLPSSSGITKAKFVLDSRVDYPAWKGHLVAYSVPEDPDDAPSVMWDAAAQLAQNDWWERRVYVGEKGTATPVKIDIDQSTHVVKNAATLYSMGLGASAQEASDIVHWMLGDPAFKNPAVLGAIVNSTPIEVSQPNPPEEQPGAKAFKDKFKAKPRPNLTYVGSDDGMLHAFFTEETTLGSAVYEAGDEAFAFIPKDMLGHITRLFVQGGQSPDPDRHLFGLASSPKAKDMCVKDCADKENAAWGTLLAMPEGFGGNRSFYLDVTEPATDLGISDPPVKVLWQTDQVLDAPKYDAALGLTMSVPAFLYNMTDNKDDYRVIFTSGYQSNAGKAEQGRRLVVAKAWNGAVVDTQLAISTAACLSPKLPTLLTDVATARDFRKDQQMKTLGTYFGDDWGTLWRYTTSGTIAPHSAFGCASPLHFAPAVTQLDGNGAGVQAGDVYIAQVTNSSLDPDTVDSAVPSQIVIMKDQADAAGAMTKATLDLRLTAGKDICAVMDDKGGCSLALPKEARPAATPTALLRSDSSGFALFSLWYVPAKAGCGKGTSYLIVHEVKNDATTQKFGLAAADEPVLGTVFAGGQIFVVTSDGLKKVGGGVVNIPIQQSQTAGNSVTLVDRFRKTAWVEVP